MLIWRNYLSLVVDQSVSDNDDADDDDDDVECWWDAHLRRLVRFLKAREWNLDEAEKQLRETVEWRRQVDPLNIDCRWCHDRPGYHCVVRIGLYVQRGATKTVERTC